jgi:hypothetical protein
VHAASIIRAALMMGATLTSETSVDIEFRTRKYIQEDSELQLNDVFYVSAFIEGFYIFSLRFFFFLSLVAGVTLVIRVPQFEKPCYRQCYNVVTYVL